MLKNTKFKILISLLVVALGAISAVFVRPILAQGTTCTSFPKTTIRNNITVQGSYRVWVLAKKESAGAKPYIQVDGGACKELAVPAGSGWEWVSAPAGGKLTETLAPGAHDFKLSVNNGAILMDKILVVSDTNCIPTATDNSAQACIERPLNFDVTGIAEGETIAGNRTIGANLTAPVAGVTVSFAFDNASAVSSPTSAPYCLIRTGTTCGSYDLSKLSEGRHTLRVSARSAAGQSVSKSIPFIVDKVDVPIPDPDPTPIIPKPTTPKPPITGKISLTVSGVKAGDTIKGSPVISSVASGVNKPISVTYKLGSVKLSHRSVAPYCLMITADNKCTGWNSNTFVNGSYNLYAIAQAEGFESVWITMPIKIANPAPATTTTAPIPKPNTPPVKEIVVGKDKQTVSGWIRLRIPKQYIKPGYTVTFKAGKFQIVKIPTVRLASADIDTTELVNGNQEVTATITSPGGSEETLTSNIDVKNNPFVSFANWVSANKMLALILGTTVIVAGMLVIGFLVFRVINKGKNGHIAGAVVGASPLEKSRAKRQALFGIVAFLVLGAATFSFYRLGSSAMAAGLGFVDEVEDGIVTGVGITQDMDHTMQRIYMRLANGTTATPPIIVHPQEPTGSCTSGQMSAMGPCVNRSLLPAARAGINRSQTSGAGAPYSTGEAGAFRHRCDFSHMNFDDSVLYPNQPGVAHLHTYFGNTGAQASSTSASLRSSGNSTCAGGTFNRSAYWVPTMVDTTNGRPIRPNDPRNQYESDLEVYYKLGYQGVGYRDIRPFPNGLQLIAGNASNATGPTADSKTHYWCESMSDKGHRNEGNSIPNCGANSILVMRVDFPQCWNGRDLTSASGRSHMAYGSWVGGYPTNSIGCPTSHPVGLPFIEMFVRYYTGSTGNANWRLSSDNYRSGPGGYSGHADYIFAWDSTAFPKVAANCYNALLDCGYSLGDRTEPTHPRFFGGWTQSLTN